MKQYEDDGKKNVEILQIFGANNRTTLFHILVDLTKIKISMKKKHLSFRSCFFNSTRFSEISRFTSQLTYREKTKTWSKNGFVEVWGRHPSDPSPLSWNDGGSKKLPTGKGAQQVTCQRGLDSWIGFFLHTKKRHGLYNTIWSKMNGNWTNGKQKKSVFGGGWWLMVA